MRMHPGTVIHRLIERNGWTQGDFARRIDATPKYVCDLVACRARVTVKMALRMEPVLNRPASFFTELQMHWDLHRARKRMMMKREPQLS